MGVLAFALDVGTFSRQERMAQAAADAAALAAAKRCLPAILPMSSGANSIAKLNGFDTTLRRTCRGHPDDTGDRELHGSAYVQATVSRPIPTMFLRAFRSSWRRCRSRHVDRGRQPDQPDLRVLEGASGQDLNMSNDSSITANSCGVVDDSTARMRLALLEVPSYRPLRWHGLD